MSKSSCCLMQREMIVSQRCRLSSAQVRQVAPICVDKGSPGDCRYLMCNECDSISNLQSICYAASCAEDERYSQMSGNEQSHLCARQLIRPSSGQNKGSTYYRRSLLLRKWPYLAKIEPPLAVRRAESNPALRRSFCSGVYAPDCRAYSAIRHLHVAGRADCREVNRRAHQ